MIDRLLAQARSAENTYLLAFNVTGGLNFLYLIVAGLVLGTDSYGLFIALFGVVYLVSALANTIQLATAKQIAAHGGDLSSVIKPAAIATAGVTAFLLAATPALTAWFNASTADIVWTAAAAGLTIAAGTGYGVAQGQQRFNALSASQVVMGGGRIAIGLALLGAGFGVSGALAGVALSYLPSLLVIGLSTRSARTAGADPPASVVPSPSTLLVTFIASVAVAALTSLDVVIIQHFFAAEESSAYASIAVLGRVVLFVPIAVSHIVLPRAAARADARLLTPALTKTLALSLLTGGVIMAAASAGFSPTGDVSAHLGATAWYLLGMVAISGAVPIAYYQIERGNYSVAYAALLPGIAAAAAGLLLYHPSLVAAAQVLCTVHLGVLAGAIALSLPQLTAESRPRLGAPRRRLRRGAPSRRQRPSSRSRRRSARRSARRDRSARR